MKLKPPHKRHVKRPKKRRRAKEYNDGLVMGKGRRLHQRACRHQYQTQAQESEEEAGKARKARGEEMKAQEMLDLAECIDRVICNGVTLRDAPEMGKIGRLLRDLAAQADAPAEEMENYRMALAYISKQSTDPKSRELAETALNAFPNGGQPQSPAAPVGVDEIAALLRDELSNMSGFDARVIGGIITERYSVSRPDRKSKNG